MKNYLKELSLFFELIALLSLFATSALADQIVYIGGTSKIVGSTYNSIGANAAPAYLDYSDSSAWANFTSGGRTTDIYPTVNDDLVIKRLDTLQKTDVGYDANCKVIFIKLYDADSDRIQNIDVKNLTLATGYNNDANGVYAQGTISCFNKASIKVANDLTSTSYVKVLDYTSLQVGGNIISTIQQYANYYGKSASVKGDIIFNFNNAIADGSITFFSSSTANGQAASIDNPNTVIGGVARQGDSWKTNTSNLVGYLNLSSQGVKNAFYTSINGMKNAVSLKSNSVGSQYLVLKNSADCDNYGNIAQDNTSIITLVMYGSATQTFNGKSLAFTNGARVISGNLLVNFAETSGVNHGVLTMEGGLFGNANSSVDSIGAGFEFSNVIYKTGEIKLQVKRNSQNTLVWDKLSLSDGTIALAEGAGQTVKINLTGAVEDLADLIDSSENGGKGIKVVSWVAKSAIDDSSFISDAFSYDSKDYVSSFTQDENGLYVKYVQAIPEPASCAAILCALALTLVVYRRKK